MALLIQLPLPICSTLIFLYQPVVNRFQMIECWFLIEPNGLHWDHQYSWTLTSANCMQVSNIEFLTVTGSNQTQGKVSLSDCEKAEHSVLGQVGKRSRIHWTMEVLTHKMKQKWNNFQSFISDIFSRITSIVLLSIVHQNNHNLFQLKNHPSTTLYNNISILLSKKKST